MIELKAEKYPPDIGRNISQGRNVFNEKLGKTQH